VSALERLVLQPRRRVSESWPWLLVAFLWIVLIVVSAAGYRKIFDHDMLLGSGRLPPVTSILAFALSWQLMTVAMLLPGSMALIGLFRQANHANRGSRWATLAFLAGYVAIWTAFTGFALVGDSIVHRVVNSVPWLADRPWLIAGTTLIVAGGFQFTSLKERCLAQCRSPLAFFVRYYRRGWVGALRLGAHHGRFCLGCCWALMLLMFGLGVGSVAWMVNLAAVSFVERTTESGGRFVPIFGAILVGWGLVVLFQWPPQLVALAFP
jgi:predicted metal-binding membrane protein